MRPVLYARRPRETDDQVAARSRVMQLGVWGRHDLDNKMKGAGAEGKYDVVQTFGTEGRLSVVLRFEDAKQAQEFHDKASAKGEQVRRDRTFEERRKLRTRREQQFYARRQGGGGVSGGGNSGRFNDRPAGRVLGGGRRESCPGPWLGEHDERVNNPRRRPQPELPSPEAMRSV